jgi:hypothetical protein
LLQLTLVWLRQQTFHKVLLQQQNTDTTPHLLELKATQQGGTESQVSGFSLDVTNAVGAQANSQLLVFATDSSVIVMEAKVRTSSDQVIDLVPITSQQATNTFSLTNLASGVYTLDVITQKGNTKAAYEGILVIGQQPTNQQTQTIIEQQITDENENGNGGNGSNGKLDVSIAIGHDPIVRGNIQTISITVTDSQSKDGISGAKIDGQVNYVTGHIERFSGISNGDGKYQHQWRISGNAVAGTFQVKVDVSASGYGTASASSSFRVTGASQTGLLSQPDPCLVNSTLTDCQPDPCDLPDPPPGCVPTECPNGQIMPPGEPCPDDALPCDVPDPPPGCSVPSECPDGSIIPPGEQCPEEPSEEEPSEEEPSEEEPSEEEPSEEEPSEEEPSEEEPSEEDEEDEEAGADEDAGGA